MLYLVKRPNGHDGVPLGIPRETLAILVDWEYVHSNNVGDI